MEVQPAGRREVAEVQVGQLEPPVDTAMNDGIANGPRVGDVGKGGSRRGAI